MCEKLQELLKLKSGGTYVPPAKLKALMAEVELEKNSEEFQKLQWDQLKKEINGIVNKVNKENIKALVVELFRLNLFRGKGLLCSSLMKSQQLSTAYTDIYASLVSVLNSKIPDIGNLLIRRLILRYKRLFRREDKENCKSTIIFLSELANFHVCGCNIITEIGSQLLENPNEFKVEMAVTLLYRCSIIFHDNESVWFDRIKNKLRNILNEDVVDSRTQFLIQEFFDSSFKKIQGGISIDEELDLVDEDDAVIHNFSLTNRIQGEDQLDVFQYDAEYQKNDEEYNTLKRDILGSDAESESEFEDENESGNGDEANTDFLSDNEQESESEDDDSHNEKLTVEIKDLTEQELTNFQKNVYLTVMSSMSPEEATHKLLRLKPIDPARKEYMLVDMIIKCCAQEKVYSKYYGLIGESLAAINNKWSSCFQQIFKENYANCHRYETALLRNIGAFWGHMFASDKLGWECLSVVELTEQTTTSSGRIFIKFIFQRMLEEVGINHLIERIEEPYIKDFIVGIFPNTNPEHLRFSINFFTAIGLGKLTEQMRQCLENLPSETEAITEGPADVDSDSSRGRSRSRSSSYSSVDSRNRSYSRSRSRSNPRQRYSENDRNNNPDYDRERGRDFDRGRSRSPSNRDRSFSRSRSPSERRGNDKRFGNSRPSIPKGPRGSSFNRRGYRGRNTYGGRNGTANRRNHGRGNSHYTGYDRKNERNYGK